MPIISNPKTRRIHVAVGEARVILILRSYTTDEYLKFLNARYSFNSRSGNLALDDAMSARLELIDTLLVGIEAVNEKGQPDTVTFAGSDGFEQTLTPSVPDWKRLVNPSWKIAAAMLLEKSVTASEGEDLKN